MMVEIKDFASLSAILDESQIYLGGLGQYIWNQDSRLYLWALDPDDVTIK